MKATEYIISPFKVSEDFLFAPKSFLVDSFVQAVEEIQLAKITTDQGSVNFLLSPNSLSKNKDAKSFFRRIKPVSNKVIELSEKSVFIDLRVNSPANVSHAIMIHLPITILVQKFFADELLNKELVLILPKNIPQHISEMFEALGYNYVATNSPILGLQIKFEASSWAVCRGELSSILSSGIRSDNFINKIQSLSKKTAKKLFISRKSGRVLKNESEIEGVLTSLGYQKIYMEEYSILEQVAMVSHADSIVAIHGAALGLLSFRAVFNLPPIQLLELFPASHMTNVYRVLAHQLGGKWTGVRGKLSKEIIEFLYDAKPGDIRKYSQSDFEICKESLLMALGKLEQTG